MLKERVERTPDDQLIKFRNQDGEWDSYTATQFFELIQNIGKGLLAYGIQKNDKIAILSNTRWEWTALDFAALSIGAVVVPIYQTDSSNQVTELLQAAEVKLLFAEDEQQAEGEVTYSTREITVKNIENTISVYVEENKAKQNGVIFSTDAKVVFEHANLCYPGAGADSLTDIHVEIRKGETVGIIGGTGSGKSSLVQMIPRFYDATAGRVLVDGKDVKTYETEVLRDKIGIVPQKAVLFRGSIRENICWGKENASDEEIWKALTAAQAKSFVEEKEGGLDFAIAQGGKNLSGGQKQRLTIARALVKQPEILILDDSASALDYATDAALRRSIKELDKDMTVFIVSQRTASVLHADKIIVLEDGEVAGIGTHEELLGTCPVYKEIHESQISKGGRD